MFDVIFNYPIITAIICIFLIILIIWMYKKPKIIKQKLTAYSSTVKNLINSINDAQILI